MTETIKFQVDCEWLCNFVRQRVWYEGLPFTDGLKVLVDSFTVDEETAHDILCGKKKIVGINTGFVEDDDQYPAYLEYLKREEEKKARHELEEDILILPMKYFDRFACCWSYEQFCNQIGNDIITRKDMEEWFCRPPCEMETDPFLEGGMWSVDPDVAQFIIKDSSDTEKFYKRLYEIVDEWIHDRNIPEAMKARLTQRQINYQQWLTKAERRERRIQKYIEQGKAIERAKEREKKSSVKKDKWPHWVIDKNNSFTLYNPDESFYLREAKFVPCDEGMFYKYGLISPEGDFYACQWGAHNAASFKIAKQKGYIKPVKNQFYEYDDDKWEYGGETYRDVKDLLFHLGWVFVNASWGSTSLKDGAFFSKYGPLEDMPQKVMDTCYDWQIWWREVGSKKDIIW